MDPSLGSVDGYDPTLTTGIRQSTTSTIRATDGCRSSPKPAVKKVEAENETGRVYYGTDNSSLYVEVPARRNGQQVRTYSSSAGSTNSSSQHDVDIEVDDGDEGYKMPVMASEDNLFIASEVEAIVRDTLETRLREVRYDAKACSSLAQELCLQIRERTKQFEFDRCKLVAQVMIGQDTDQSVQIATRCLWNHTTDNFAAATFRNSWIYAVAIVYGLFLE